MFLDELKIAVKGDYNARWFLDNYGQSLITLIETIDEIDEIDEISTERYNIKNWIDEDHLNARLVIAENKLDEARKALEVI